MGNQLTCMASGKSVKGSQISIRRSSSKDRRRRLEEEHKLLQEQQQLMALYQHKSQLRERTMSQRYSDAAAAAAAPLRKGFLRSSSSRPRSLGDPDLQPHQLLKNFEVGAVESRHFVLVHGGGYGAWCWYKSIALLEEAGFVTTAVDLAGSGIEPTDPNLVSSLAQYAKPLLDLLDELPADDKVILVAHDFGGACVSYAMESHAGRIAKAVFVAAAMVGNGQSALDVFQAEVMTAEDMLPRAQVFTYANGDSSAPTSLAFDRDHLKELLFNRSPAKDVALATVSLRPIPFAPVLEKLLLSAENYGRVRKFFVHTTDDNALTFALQERLVNLNTPEQTFRVRGSDHSPFFSKPQSLHKILVEIAQL